MCIVKSVMRIAVVGGLATGVAVLVAGPERVAALAGQCRQAVRDKIDQNIEDPVELRSQLRNLESEYPKRITSVRADLAELEAQLAELERDRNVSQRVVEMASADLLELKDMLARAEGARTEAPTAVINVRFDNQAFSLNQAYSRATQINNTLNVYSTRAADADRDLGFLNQQKERLAELLATLETERAQFQAQIWQLDGQIEMIARNEKLIDIVEKRQESIDRHSQFEAVSLDQITSRMAQIRAEQEARLQSLASHTETTNYEKKAKVMLDTENTARDVFHRAEQIAPPLPLQGKIEIVPQAAPTNASPKSDQTTASAAKKPVTIE